ncbi:MAG: DUF6476 family protein [Paracoccaceae bacterium]
MSDPDEQPQLPPGLRFLRGLVIALMITMIAGVITVVGLLVTRMPDGNAPLALPDTLALPQGARPLSITQGPGWIGVVTQDSRLLIFRQDGSLRQEIMIAP